MSVMSMRDQSVRPDQSAGPSLTAPSDGAHPDYRCTLANEATYLSWIHTCLGLLAGAIAARHLAVRADLAGVRDTACDAAASLSAALIVFAYRRLRAVEHAMTEQRPLPSPRRGEVAVAAAAGLLVVTGVLCLQR
jgi:putative membrane protein